MAPRVWQLLLLVLLLAAATIDATPTSRFTIRFHLAAGSFSAQNFVKTISQYITGTNNGCPCSFAALPASSETTASVSFVFATGAAAHCAVEMNSIAASPSTSDVFLSFGNALAHGANPIGTSVNLLAVSVSQEQPAAPPGNGDGDDGNRVWVYVGAGCVAGLVVILGIACLLVRSKERRRALEADERQGDHLKPLSGQDQPGDASHSCAPASSSSSEQPQPAVPPRAAAAPPPRQTIGAAHPAAEAERAPPATAEASPDQARV